MSSDEVNKGGRPKGSMNIRTRELMRQYLNDGEVTPLEIFVECMRGAWKKAQTAKRPEKREKAIKLATEYAERAAPYLHPALRSIEMTGDEEQPIPIKIVISPEEIEAAMKRFNKKY